MRSLAVAGACLVAATAICVIGSLINSPRPSSVICAISASTAFAGAATGYGAVAVCLGRAVPATGLALVGVSTSLWMVEATLQVATEAPGSAGRALPILGVIAGGMGLFLLAAGFLRAGLIRRPIGLLLATSSCIAAISADPTLLYLLGAAPLGIALLWTGRSGLRTTRRENAQ